MTKDAIICISLVLFMALNLLYWVFEFEVVNYKNFKNNTDNLHGYIVKLDKPLSLFKNKNIIIGDFAILKKKKYFHQLDMAGFINWFKHLHARFF